MFRQGMGGVQSCFRGGGGFGPPIFMPNLKAGGTGVDLVSGVAPVTSISGTRYGIVNNTVTQFAANQPPIEDDGLRGCPAFTQYFLNNEAPVTQSITLAAGSYCLWIEGSGSATFNGLTATSGVPKVFTLASGFTGNCVITGTVTRCMLNTGLFPAPFSPTEGVTKSFVSEAATATTGTSFDLDDVKLARLKTALRGSTYGQTELANYNTVQQSPANTGTNYINYLGNETYRLVSDGTYIDIRWPSVLAVVGKIYEITYTEIAKASGSIIGGLGGQNTTFTSGSQTLRVTATTTGLLFFGRTAGAPCDITFKVSVKEVQAQGHLELTFKSNLDSRWLSASQQFNIFTCANAGHGPLYVLKDNTNTNWRCYDGTTILAISDLPISINQIFKISLNWGTHSTGKKMRITVNGVKSVLANFSGSFGAQDLRFFYGNTVNAGWIVKDSLKIMDRPIW